MNEYTNVICGCGLPPQSTTGSRKKTIDLTIGVFFDGTANNKYNLDSGLGKTNPKKYKDDDSYFGSYTNVTHLWEAYSEDENHPFNGKVYIEGIATYQANEDGKSSGKEDHTIGAAVGKGETGIPAKVERGCTDAVKKIKIIQKQQDGEQAGIGTITLDVYGFSRGAAAARHFAGCLKSNNKKTERYVSDELKLSGSYMTPVVKVYEVCLKDHLEAADIKYTNLEVRILGIFDTVSSYAPGSVVDWNFDNDVDELELKIASDVKKTVHIVAADEWRKNFALTRACSAGSKGEEIILPGAHSDIGGGYAQIESEPVYMTEDVPYNLGVMYDALAGVGCWRGYLTFEQMDEDGWLNHPLFTDESGEFMKKVKDTYNSQNFLGRHWSMNHARALHLMVQKRPVLNHYSIIPLSVMINKSSGENVCFNKEQISKKTDIHAKAKYGKLYDPYFDKLRDFKTKADAGLNFYTITGENKFKYSCEEDVQKLIKSLRGVFMHLSARNRHSYVVFSPHKAATNNERKIIVDGKSSEMIDSPIKQIKKTDKTAILMA